MDSNFKKANIFKKLRVTEEIIILIILLLTVGVVSILIPEFRKIDNLLMVSRQFSLITIVAIGETIALIAGGFDLSVGAVAALSGMSVSYMIVNLNWPISLSILISAILAGLCGLFNGILIGKLKINPLIATLATSWIFSGIIIITTKGWPITKIPDMFSRIGQGYISGIPIPTIIMLIIGVIASIFLSKTIFGREIYAVGGNLQASILSGINADRVIIMSYTLCSLCAGIAGIILVGRVGSATVTGGVEWALPAVAGAVVGGVRLGGGKGFIYGAIIGSSLLGVINNILVLSKVSSYWQSLITGFILLIAVSIDSIKKFYSNR